MYGGDIMTNTSLQQILNSITIICDTREHNDDGNCINILTYFDNNKIPYIRRKLDFGDYSFEAEGQSYEQKLAIERKMNLTELSGCLAQSRERFEAELIRSKEAHAKLILLCEDGSYQGIIEHKYRTALSEKSFMASIFTYIHRYGIDVQFIPAKYAGAFIHGTFYYYLRNLLKEADST
jgi:ERCC4-type nuclease